MPHTDSAGQLMSRYASQTLRRRFHRGPVVRARYDARCALLYSFLSLRPIIGHRSRISENSLLRTLENKRPGILGFLFWPMADRFNVVAVRIEDEGAVVVPMVLGANPRTTVVARTRRDGRLMEGINSSAVIGSKRDVEGLAWLALADPEIRLTTTARTPPQIRWVP